MSGYTIRKVSELAAEYGEEFVNNVTNSFSCRFNDEVDDFLKRNSLDFARRKVSVTELVFDNESQLCAGYFTLAVKPIQIPASALSSTQRKRVERFSKLDPSTESYTVAAYLIAQFGKNFNTDGNVISGAELLAFAINHIRRAQDEVGGQIVFLEMEHGNSKLETFYGNCGFRYEDGTPLRLGDIVETNPPECQYDEWKRGRVIKIFGPTPTQESLEWHLEPGRWHIIVERDDGGLEGFFELDEHIRFVSRGRNNE